MNMGHNTPLRKRRRELDISQQDLADKACVNRKTISLIENNRSNPRPLVMNALAKALDTTVEELFPEDER